MRKKLINFLWLSIGLIMATNTVIAQGNDITSFPWEEGFESNTHNDWTIYNVDGDGATWELNETAAYVRTGTASFWHGTQFGETQEGWLVTPKIIVPETGNITFSFWWKHDHTYSYEENSVWISTNGANPTENEFVKVWTAPNPSTEWTETRMDLSGDYAGEEIYIAFKYYGFYPPAWFIDDVSVFNFSGVTDLGVTEITSPNNGLNMTDEEQVKALIKNEGSEIITEFSLKLEIDGVEAATETVTETITSLSSYEYTFATTIDLSEEKEYNVKVTVILENDINANNNTAEKTVINYGNTAIMGLVSSVSTCNGIFVDDGIYENYSGGYETQTITFTPANPGDRIKVDFTALNLATSPYVGGTNDVLYVYEGSSPTYEMMIAQLSGDMSDDLPSFSSLADDGALTFHLFKATYSEGEGWIANVSCHTPSNHDLAVESITPNYVVGGIAVTPKVTVKNLGNAPVSAWSITLVDGESYTSTVNGPVVEPLQTVSVAMDAWSPSATTTLTATVNLSEDGDLSNNELSVEKTVGNYIDGGAYAGNYTLSTYNTVDIETGDMTELSAMGASIIQLPVAEEYNGAYVYRIYSDYNFGVVYPNGEYESLGQVTGSDYTITGLSYDWYNDIWYLMAIPFTGNSTLYELDINTLTLTEIGASSVENNLIAMDMYVDGYLYGPGVDDVLYKINPTTGENIAIGSLGIDINNAQDVSFNGADPRLYTFASQDYYTNNYGYYDITTGAFTEIVSLGVGQCLPFVITTIPPSVSDVTFNVTVDTRPIEGFEIKVGTISLTTNAMGEVTHKFVNGVYDYVAEKFGYETKEGNFTVNNVSQSVNINTVEYNTYSVAFNIVSHINEPLDASVVLKHNDKIMYEQTANNGVVSFDNVVGVSYVYDINHNDYEPILGEVLLVDSNKQINVKMEDIIIAPYGLEVEVIEETSDALFSWNNIYELFFDDMESHEDFIIENIGDYTLIDGDGIATYGLAYSDTDYYLFDNNGYTGSYIVMNPYTTQPSMTGLWTPHGGNKVLACHAALYTPEKTNNDWLILPKITIGDDMVFKFWALTVAPSWGAERIKVGISSTGTEQSDFIFIQEDDYIEVADTWTEYSFDLSDYAQQEIYLAINCVSSNTFQLLIDDVYVGREQSRNTRSISNYVVFLNGEEQTATSDTQYKFTNLANGTYTAGVKAVYSSGESMMVTSEPFTISGNSIDNVLSSFILYPNPSDGNFTIEVEQGGEMNILDMTGKLVYESKLEAGANQISTHLSQGVYIVNITVDKSIKTQKLIIK